MYDDNNTGIETVKKCIEEMRCGDYSEKLGMLESNVAVQSMIDSNAIRIGSK